MRLNLILPKVEPTVFEYPKKCPRKGCPGMRFIPRQEVSKKIVDAQHPEVTAWRCECRKCGHVFRVYPKGVSQKQISKRVSGFDGLAEKTFTGQPSSLLVSDRFTNSGTITLSVLRQTARSIPMTVR